MHAHAARSSRQPRFALICCLFITTSALAAPEFGTRRMLPVGKNPDAVAAADFDEDGILDLAVADQGGSGLSILIGLGGGRFAPAVPIGAGHLLAVVAADLNGDGHVDLALTGLGPSQLVVMNGDGAGHFTPGYSGGSTTRSGYLALGDFNKDGVWDLVVSNNAAGTVGVFTGDGAGSFTGPLTFAVGSFPAGVVTGDFDLDGRPDIVVTFAGGGVVFLPNDGHGGFGAPVSSPGGTGAGGLAEGDLTGDGVPDVLLANLSAGTLLVLSGLGNGQFAALPGLPIPASDLSSVAIGDLDGDGHPDLIAGGSADSIQVLVGTGPGTWGPFTSYRSGGPAVGLLVRDMNGDGWPDVTTANLLSNDVALLSGDGMGRLRSEVEIGMPWSQSTDLVAADFNEDGQVDLAVLNSEGPNIFECNGPPGPIDCGNQMNLVVATGDGMGRFGAPTLTHARCAPIALAAADFDLDGHVDVVVANQGARDAFGICAPASLSFFPGDGAGRFGPPHDLVVPDQPTDVAAGDFDEDGRPDVVVGFSGTHLVRQYRLSTAGDLVAASGVELLSDPLRLKVADLDGDGHLDVAVSEPLINTVAFLHGDGEGLLGFQSQCNTLGTAPQGLAVADFDGDGRLDVAAGNHNAPGTSTSTISVLHQDVNHLFCQPGSIDLVATGDRPSDVLAADFDTDGTFDLVESDGGLKFTSFPTFGPASPHPPDHLGAYGTGRLVSADFDGNGLPDIAMGSSGMGPAISVVLNTTPRAARLLLQVGNGRIDWIGVADALGYDLVRGSVTVLNATHGDYSAATQACLAADVAATIVAWSEDPPVGTLWWVLARPFMAAGPGTYDSGSPGQVGSRDAGIAASGLACP